MARHAYLGFCERGDLARPDGIVLTLVTDDVDGWHRRLIAEGLQCKKPPVYNPTYKIYQTLFRDPKGYLFKVQRFEDPRWRSEGVP